MATDDTGIVGDELLSKTGGGGLFSDGYLAERPIASYLRSDEQPRVVFATDGSGVVRERPPGRTTCEPGSGYRTLVALTSHRVVLVVGGVDAGSDRSFDMPLTRVDYVETASGFRESTVRFWVGDEVWELSPATTDPETIETYLSTASQRRIRFERLLEEAEDAIVAAADACSAGRLEAGASALERADRTLEEARDPLDSFPADVPDMADRLAAYRQRYRTETERLLARRAEQARAEARELWRAGEYEAAADAYQRARDVCVRVLEREQLSAQAGRRVRSVRTSIERDRKRLFESPIRVAAAFDRAAAASTLPGEAADRWRRAYERYRQVLELDWGVDADRFTGDADRIRERLRTIAVELLAARSRAAAINRRASVRLMTVRSPAAAMDAAVDAEVHLRAAVETARELDPSAVPSLRERLEAVERRVAVLAGSDAETGRPVTRTSGALPVGAAGPIQPRFDSQQVAPVPVRTDESLPVVRRATRFSERHILKSVSVLWAAMDPAGIYARPIEYLDRHVQVGVAGDRVVAVSFPETPAADAGTEHPLLDRLVAYFEGESVPFESASVALTMASDHRDVLETLRSVPHGEDITVEQLTRMTPGLDPDTEADARLVRSALAENPVPLLVPDHRVRDGPSGAPPAVEQKLRSLEGLA